MFDIVNHKCLAGAEPFSGKQRHATVIFYSIVHDSNAFIQVIRIDECADFVLSLPTSSVVWLRLNWLQHFHQKKKLLVSSLYCGLHLASTRRSEDHILIFTYFTPFNTMLVLVWHGLLRPGKFCSAVGPSNAASNQLGAWPSCRSAVDNSNSADSAKHGAKPQFPVVSF